MTSLTSLAGRKLLCTVGLILMFLGPGSLPAQTNISLSTGTNVAPHHPGRYLLVLETSASMRKRSANTQKAIGYLLANALTNQLHVGDTIGIWTFNDQLHTGAFPLQQWEPDQREAIARKAVDFYKHQKLEKDPHLEQAFQSLKEVVRHSERITILFLTSGENPMHGTPFDAALNETFKRSGEELKQSKLPFVTVLRAWHGEVIGGSVTWTPWPVEFPNFPADPKPPEAVKPVEVEAKPVTPRAPLIVIGNKPTPPPVEPAAATPVAEPAETPVAEPVTPVTAPVEATPAGSQVSPTENSVEAPTQAVAMVAAPVVRPPTNSEPALAGTEPAIPQVVIPPDPGPATPVRLGSGTNILIVVSLVLLVVGLTLVFLIFRRARANARASLITRSMDRQK